MNAIYLRQLGKLTIQEECDNGVKFREIPSKIFSHSFIEKNRISREEYNSIELTKNELIESMNIRGIEYIYHFTTLNNLVSILKKGFIPRSFLQDRKMKNNFLEDFISSTPSQLNDYYRFDNLPEATNFSVSCINLPLLNHYKLKHNDRKYCILKLSKNLLLEMYGLGEYFFYHNASSNMFEKNKATYRKGQAFNNMFYDNLNVTTNNYNNVLVRDYNGCLLNEKYTTSIQAEIMINGFLSEKNIVEIIFESEADRTLFINNSSFDSILKEKYLPILKVQPRYFIEKRYEI